MQHFPGSQGLDSSLKYMWSASLHQGRHGNRWTTDKIVLIKVLSYFACARMCVWPTGVVKAYWCGTMHTGVGQCLLMLGKAY